MTWRFPGTYKTILRLIGTRLEIGLCQYIRDWFNHGRQHDRQIKKTLFPGIIYLPANNSYHVVCNVGDIWFPGFNRLCKCDFIMRQIAFYIIFVLLISLRQHMINAVFIYIYIYIRKRLINIQNCFRRSMSIIACNYSFWEPSLRRRVKKYSNCVKCCKNDKHLIKIRCWLCLNKIHV